MIWKVIAPATLLTCAALAQPPSRPAPPTDAVKSYLNLTDSQLAQLQTMAREERAASRARYREIFQKRRQLHQLLRDGNSDATSVGRMVLDMDAVRRQAQTAHKELHQQATAVLSQEQKDKLRELTSSERRAPALHQAMALNLLERPQRRAGMGPGPRMGPGSRMMRFGHPSSAPRRGGMPPPEG